MTGQTYTIFPIKFVYNGVGVETKALKHSYNKQVIYKIAMPSAISPVQQCWITMSTDEHWEVIMGNADKPVIQQLISAIKKHEQALTLYAKAEPEQELKSA
ncbi:MAG: hypothetical protein V4592_10575 [Bacteroidota bacterium]